MLLFALFYLMVCQRTKEHVYFASFCLGAALALMMVVGYSYVIEITPFKHRNTVGTIILAVDKAVLFISIFYFKFFGNHWMSLVILALFFSIISLVLNYYLPDSP